MTYTVFQRSATSFETFARARKKTIRRNLTREEARRMCDEFNSNRTAAQIRRGTKYEFCEE